MWSDSPSSGPYFRQQQRVPGYLSVSSQPNLTVYNLQNSLTPDPQTFAQVHCNQSFVQSALSDDSDDIEAKQLHKFKVVFVVLSIPMLFTSAAIFVLFEYLITKKK